MGKQGKLVTFDQPGALQKDTQESDEQMAQKAIDKSWSNSHANLMNEGDDDEWPDSWKRHQIEERKRDRSVEDLPAKNDSDEDY